MQYLDLKNELVFGQPSGALTQFLNDLLPLQNVSHFDGFDNLSCEMAIETLLMENPKS
jgi:hypothetical protein